MREEVALADFDVDAEEVETPKDDWGFPAVAGRLSQCGGARAPHCTDSQHDPDQRGKHEGLIE